MIACVKQQTAWLAVLPSRAGAAPGRAGTHREPAARLAPGEPRDPPGRAAGPAGTEMRSCSCTAALLQFSSQFPLRCPGHTEMSPVELSLPVELGLEQEIGEK